MAPHHWRRLNTHLQSFDSPILVEEEQPSSCKCLPGTRVIIVTVQDNGSKKWLKKMAHFHLKMDLGMRDDSLDTHLQSFDSPIVAEGECPSLETLA